MNEKKLVQNFTSYINVSSKNNGEKNGAVQDLKPRLLSGEAVAGSAHSVTLLSPLTDMHAHVKGKIGSLFVTNYKLTFIPLTHETDDEPCQKNFLLGVYDVPLSSVESVYLTELGSSRRRRLMPYGPMPGKVKGLQVVCKNMKVLTFAFDKSPIGQGRTVAMALIHHAYPKRHDLLFAYEHREPYYPTLPPGLNMFERPGDWKRELERCACPRWRVSCINGTTEAFMPGAGEALVVPHTAVDYALAETARHFRGGRVPVWMWGRAEGAALLRCGELATTDDALTRESVFLEHVRKSHPELTPPHVIYLCGQAGGAGGIGTGALPPPPALHASYKKLLEICTPTTLATFSTQESAYYSSLETCKWLRYVSGALAAADEAARALARNVSVVLQEGDGVDYSAVVSSLTQLLVDPHFHTISGFQSLVQKEWVALGHPFCDRLGLLEPPNPKQKDQPSGLAPMFLLFLDCVWQLQLQFPTEFQFSETYLTTLWDCCHNQIFDTFLFNCPRDRALAVSKNFVLRPVWDWGEQFSEQDMSLFYNPLYASNKPLITPKQRLSNASSKPAVTDLSRLTPSTLLAAMEVWSQCYERWLLPLDRLGAGPAQYLVYHIDLVRDIHRLKERLLSLSALARGEAAERGEGGVRRRAVPRYFPFSVGGDRAAVALGSLQPALIDARHLLDSQSLLNAPD